jgi:hypothetical protein
MHAFVALPAVAMNGGASTAGPEIAGIPDGGSPAAASREILLLERTK